MIVSTHQERYRFFLALLFLFVLKKCKNLRSCEIELILGERFFPKRKTVLTILIAIMYEKETAHTKHTLSLPVER